MPVKLFVGNLAQSVTNEMLIEMFSEYGNVVEADALGKFGFVHMETQDEAEAAIAGLNGHEVENIAIKVEISQGGKKDKGRNDRGPVTSCKLFVGNLNESITSDDLRDLFSQHGTVKEADAKGKYGFVHMSTEEEAEKCLSELKGAYIGDVAINVEISEDKKKSGSGRDDRGRRGRANDGPVKLFIGNMSEKIQSEDLRRLFSRAGDVVECTAKGRYGFVHMASWDEAQNAIRLCNRQSLKGQTLNVEESSGGGGGGGGGGGRDGRRGDGYGGRGGGYGGGRDFGYDDFPPYGGRRGGGGGGPTGDPVKIFVGNLTERTTTEDLVSLFSRYGRVIERDSQACGKFGFIHMPYMEDAERAIYELNGYHLHGVRLNVQFSQKGEKGGGPDRRRGFSRHDERPYDRPPRGMEPAPRQAMAVADYYQRTGRAPPQDDRMDRSLPPRDSYSSMYERERLAYDAYREVMARTDPYRDPYSRPTAEYRTTVDPYVRPPPESYGAKRYDEYDRSREREAPAAAPVAQAPAASAERYALTPEAAYAISRFAEVDRYRAAAGYATDPSATAATVARTANGSGDPYATATAAGYTTSATAYPTYNTYAR